MKELYECPVCGNKTLEELHEYDICTICWWEDDPVQFNDPTFTGGANKMSLNQAREAYKRGEKVV